jgi:hypothetical protein
LSCIISNDSLFSGREKERGETKGKSKRNGIFTAHVEVAVFRYECFLKDNPAEECHSDVTFDVGMTYMCVLLPGQDVIKKCGDRSPPAE